MTSAASTYSPSLGAVVAREQVNDRLRHAGASLAVSGIVRYPSVSQARKE